MFRFIIRLMMVVFSWKQSQTMVIERLCKIKICIMDKRCHKMNITTVHIITLHHNAMETQETKNSQNASIW